ncbi:MAG: DUF5318 family protein [Corynebacterium sp.]|nr:DUF5318 family protein [Corynebacterium sp.]
MNVTLKRWNSVDFTLQRQRLIRDIHAGRQRASDYQDADFLLVTAAKYHGLQTQRGCPLCESPLLTATWVHGEELGKRSGSARSWEEIARLAAEGITFSVHTVEVCAHCLWNHLLRTEDVCAA